MMRCDWLIQSRNDLIAIWHSRLDRGSVTKTLTIDCHYEARQDDQWKNTVSRMGGCGGSDFAVFTCQRTRRLSIEIGAWVGGGK